MTKIRNTTAAMQDGPAEAMLLLAESMGPGGSDAAIGRQERDGQRQLVNSDRLPTDRHGDPAAWAALGFTFGEPDPDDPLFCPATLPEGWARKASDHAMGSSITDTLGRERVSTFYKAAFHDRSAHMNLIGLHWYVTKAVEYDSGPIIFDDAWATREAVLAAMTASRDALLKEADEFRGYAADDGGRDEGNRTGCAKIAGDKAAAAAKYDAAIKALETTP